VFQFVKDLKHFVSLLNRIVNNEAQRGRVFEDDGFSDESSDVLLVLVQLDKTALLLVGVAEDADEHRRAAKIAAANDVIDGDESGFANRNFTANEFADLAF
jgi:hypothetical protein